MPSSDRASVTSSDSMGLPKKDWLQRWIHKLTQTIQTDENKKMIQVYLIDPLISHIMDRIFPYIVIMCVLFVVLTIMISLTLLLVFTRLGSPALPLPSTFSSP
jgi:hypothetical protein